GVPALMDLANDPRRRATSDDPAWKYGFWPDLERKDLLQCTLCGKIDGPWWSEKAKATLFWGFQ
uniref:BED-type domain-containing protein n=1 Tax=Aegilops tauschii subsp. strangulata TaxID=200361 RepID=A0A453CLC5_AEGTS